MSNMEIQNFANAGGRYLSAVPSRPAFAVRVDEVPETPKPATDLLGGYPNFATQGQRFGSAIGDNPPLEAHMKITTTKPKLDMHQTPGKVEIDSTATWEALGIRSVGSSIEEGASKATEQCQKFISQKVSEGNNDWAGASLGDKRKIQDVVADLAVKSGEEDQGELVLTNVPLPKVKGYPGSVSFDFTPGTVDIQA